MEFYVNQKQYNSRKSLKYDLQNAQNKMKEKPFRKLYERIKRGLTKRFGNNFFFILIICNIFSQN